MKSAARLKAEADVATLEKAGWVRNSIGRWVDPANPRNPSRSTGDAVRFLELKAKLKADLAGGSFRGPSPSLSTVDETAVFWDEGED